MFVISMYAVSDSSSFAYAVKIKYIDIVKLETLSI